MVRGKPPLRAELSLYDFDRDVLVPSRAGGTADGEAGFGASSDQMVVEFSTPPSSIVIQNNSDQALGGSAVNQSLGVRPWNGSAPQPTVSFADAEHVLVVAPGASLTMPFTCKKFLLCSSGAMGAKYFRVIGLRSLV